MLICAFCVDLPVLSKKATDLNGCGVTPFFAFPPEIRRVIYTTNAIESVNARIRKAIKTRGHFPNDEAATKLIWLALSNITKEWAMPVFHWKAAMTQFAIMFGDRFTKHVA